MRGSSALEVVGALTFTLVMAFLVACLFLVLSGTYTAAIGLGGFTSTGFVGKKPSRRPSGIFRSRRANDRRRSEMSDSYDSYGIRETEVAIEEFVNRLVELYPDLDPVRASELIAEQVQEMVTAANRGE
jgi:hypothetical protein